MLKYLEEVPETVVEVKPRRRPELKKGLSPANSSNKKYRFLDF